MRRSRLANERYSAIDGLAQADPALKYLNHGVLFR